MQDLGPDNHVLGMRFRKDERVIKLGQSTLIL